MLSYFVSLNACLNLAIDSRSFRPFFTRVSVLFGKTASSRLENLRKYLLKDKMKVKQANSVIYGKKDILHVFIFKGQI